jgi:uncharacterized protein (TIGR02611 family)
MTGEPPAPGRSDTSGPSPAPPTTPAPRPRWRRQTHPPSHLSRAWRITFIVSGWLVILLGIIDMPLPGPGFLVIALGAAMLSLASETAYWMFRWLFHRWPRGWRKVERVRRRVFRKLTGTKGEKRIPRAASARRLAATQRQRSASAAGSAEKRNR